MNFQINKKENSSESLFTFPFPYFPPKGSLFSNVGFLSLWGAQILTQIGIRLFDFVLAIDIFKLTKSNASVSFLILSYGAPALLFSSFAGILVDKWNKKGTILAVNLLRFLLIFSFIYVNKNVPIILLYAFLASLVSQFFVPAEGSLIPLLVRKDNLLTANSLFTLTYYSSTALGFIGAGPLIFTLGGKGAYIFISLLFLVSSFLTIFIPNKEKKFLFSFLLRKNKVTKEFIFSQLKEGLYLIRRTPTLKYALLFMSISQIIVAMYMSLMPGLAVTILGLRPEDSSIYLMGPSALGMVLGAIFISRFGKKIGVYNLIKLGALGTGIAFAFISKLPNLQKISTFIQVSKVLANISSDNLYLHYRVDTPLVLSGVFLALLSGFFNSFITVSCNTLIQKYAGVKNRGKVYGFLQTIVNSSGAIPVILGGISADYLGISTVFAFLSVIIFIVIFFVILPSKKFLYIN